jgi:magnesium transporter
MSPQMSCTWIELNNPSLSQLEELSAKWNIHPLAIEDCLHRNQRSKFEDFEHHQFMVFHAVTPNEVLEFHFVIKPDALIMVSDHTPADHGTWREFLRLQPDGKDVHHLLYSVLDRIMDMSSASVRSFYGRLRHFEQQIFTEDLDPRSLLILKHQVAESAMDTINLPSVISQWIEYSKPKGDLKWKLRDILDHAERNNQSLQFYQSQIAAAMDSYWGWTSKLVNDQMRKLTLMAAVFVPLTFWTGFFGMNFQTMPFGQSWFFWGALALMFSSVGVYWYVLRRKGYW